MEIDNKMRAALICRVLVLDIMITAILYGCESQKKMIDPKAELEKLAEQYWTKRLVDKDYQFTYNLEIEKESLPFSDYLKRVKTGDKFQVLSVKVKEIQIDEDRGVVYLSAKCEIPLVPKDFEMMLQDLWLLKSNQWKHKLAKK